MKTETYITITPVAIRNALEVEKSLQSTTSFLESRLRTMFDMVNDDGKQQANLDAFTNPAQLIAWYAAARDLVLAVKTTTNIPAIDPTVFVVNHETGAVTYIAPLEPKEPVVE